MQIIRNLIAQINVSSINNHLKICLFCKLKFSEKSLGITKTIFTFHLLKALRNWLEFVRFLSISKYLLVLILETKAEEMNFYLDQNGNSCILISVESAKPKRITCTIGKPKSIKSTSVSAKRDKILFDKSNNCSYSIF